MLFVPAVNRLQAVRLIAGAVPPLLTHHIRLLLTPRIRPVLRASGGTALQTPVRAAPLLTRLTQQPSIHRRQALIPLRRNHLRRHRPRPAASSITILPVFTAPVLTGFGTASIASRKDSSPEQSKTLGLISVNS